MARTKPQSSEASATGPRAKACVVSIVSLCSLEESRDPETSGYTAPGSLPLDRDAGGDSMPMSCDHPSSAGAGDGTGGPAVSEILWEGQCPVFLLIFSLKEATPPLQKPRCKGTCGFSSSSSLLFLASPDSRTCLPRGNSFHEDWLRLILPFPWPRGPGLTNLNTPSNHSDWIPQGT